MRWRTIATVSFASGALALGLLAAPSANGASAAAALQQPSPRPTLVPTATPRPTSQPSTQPTSQPSSGHKSTAVYYGRVTGTVIDQTTGAPAAGVMVKIGDDTVKTDFNGNYDHWMKVGSYSIALALPADRGTLSQSGLMVDIGAEKTTTQHLFFRSPAAQPQPTAQPTSEPTSEPTAAPATAPTAAPAAAPAAAPTVKNDAPKNLPSTGVEDAPLGFWLWIALGLVIIGGAVISRSMNLVARRRPSLSSNDAGILLSALLKSTPRNGKRNVRETRAENSELLQSLLRNKQK